VSGLKTIFWKELEDDFVSWRFIILFALIVGAAVFAIQAAYSNIRAEVGTTEFVFLKLFTVWAEEMPFPFYFFLILIFIPIVGVMFGFDAINSEKNSGTMSRLLSQPIYRDAVINGKFLAGIVTIAIMLLSIILLISGMGLRMIGVPPTSEELVRLMAFWGMCVVYGAFWLGLAMLFSIFFRKVATSALASVGVWIFFFTSFQFGLSSIIANIVAPAGETTASQLRNIEVAIIAGRMSPIGMFVESGTVLLEPFQRTYGQVIQLLTGGAAAWMIPNPLPIGQSILIIWPHIVGLIAATAVCFAISYAKFMREEIRST